MVHPTYVNLQTPQVGQLHHYAGERCGHHWSIHSRCLRPAKVHGKRHFHSGRRSFINSSCLGNRVGLFRCQFTLWDFFQSFRYIPGLKFQSTDASRHFGVARANHYIEPCQLSWRQLKKSRTLIVPNFFEFQIVKAIRWCLYGILHSSQCRIVRDWRTRDFLLHR